MHNVFDNMRVDIAQKHKELNAPGAVIATKKFQRGFFRRYFDKALYAIGWYEKLVDAGFIRGWFLEFEEYWRTCLGGRPFRFHDFHFLRGVYRQRFQDIGVDDHASGTDFLHAYQDPKNLYSTFGAVYKYALNPWHYFPLRTYIKRGDAILEYGCGIAPIVTGLINDGLEDFDFTIADIEQFTYHYAKFRLKQFGVTTIDIDPAAVPALPRTYNIIFCMTVLEHLQQPFAVVRNLTEHLETGGYFVFDYFLSDGTFLDTQEAIDQRQDVLRYIEEHYDIVQGEIQYDKTTWRTVGRKK